MCGIAGFCNWKTDWEKNIRKMNDRMRHRGPDASGIWASEDGSVVFGHQRLSIVDLSENGAQPMQSHSGRFEIAFNGEIIIINRLRNGFWMKKRWIISGEVRIRRCFWRLWSIMG